jgi:cell division protein FtsN
MTNLKKQAGGTLLGLIIGLIIGLGIAVGVAMVISKTPLPFTNKFGHSDKITQPAGDIADPNKPLYGKKPVVPEQPAPQPAQTAPAPSVIENTIKAPAAQNNATKPGDDEDKWVYFLQAGAFRGKADAESMKAKLALLGFEASVSERQADTGTLYRVRIGPFNQMETMNRVRGKLSDNGVDVAVVRIGK